MVPALVFAATLLVAVAISDLARRSILSTAVLFLLVGAGFGQLGFGLFDPRAEDPTVALVTELALFAVLFTDGMRLGGRELRAAWRLSGRLLLFGMPLTFAIVTIVGKAMLGLSWPAAMLVAAALAPTDPILASAIVGRRDVPRRVRTLLNVESGLNDGLALPAVVVLLHVLSEEPVDLPTLVGSLAGGVALGVALPLAVGLALRFLPGSSTARYEALAPVAVGTVVFTLAELTGVNPFLAAFSAGITMTSVSPRLSEAFSTFGELGTELLKLAILMLFGALVTSNVLLAYGGRGLVFAVVVLTLGRAAAVGVALAGSQLHRKELATVAWFGPKGFSSVVFGILVYTSSVPDAHVLAELVAVTVVLSILVHSTTDVAIAKWFASEEARPEPPA